MMKNGSYYRYTNVSRRALLNLDYNPSTVRNILLNPSTNQVMVQFKNNAKTYLYENVDVEAITDVFFGEITSFGKFVNAYCKGNLTTVVG